MAQTELTYGGLTMKKDIEEFSTAIEKQLRVPTMPVAIKLVREAEDPPPKAKYPLKDFGHRMAVCQGMTIARTIGWTMAFRKGGPCLPTRLGFSRSCPP